MLQLCNKRIENSALFDNIAVGGTEKLSFFFKFCIFLYG